MSTDALVKVFFELDSNEWHASHSESVWAQPINSAAPGVAEILNTPFFAMNVSYRDIVRCKISEDGGWDFSEIVSRSGHSTYRIIPSAPDNPAFLDLIEQLAQTGCTYESGKRHGRPLYAFDLPPTADVERIFRLLEVGERDGNWVFEQGHYCPPAERSAALQ